MQILKQRPALAVIKERSRRSLHFLSQSNRVSTERSLSSRKPAAFSHFSSSPKLQHANVTVQAKQGAKIQLFNVKKKPKKAGARQIDTRATLTATTLLKKLQHS